MSYFATLIYTAFRTRPAPSALELERHEKLRAELGSARTWIAIACGAVFVQLLLGALVRHLGAAMVCLGMPTCTIGGDWWPDAGVQHLHMIHRAFGVVVAIVTTIAAVMVCRRAQAWPQLRAARAASRRCSSSRQVVARHLHRADDALGAGRGRPLRRRRGAVGAVDLGVADDAAAQRAVAIARRRSDALAARGRARVTARQTPRARRRVDLDRARQAAHHGDGAAHRRRRDEPRARTRDVADARCGCSPAPALIVGSANTLNMWLERDIDCLMARTQEPPAAAAAGSHAQHRARVRRAPGRARAAGRSRSSASITAALGLLALILYVGVYTPMKQRSHWAVVGRRGARRDAGADGLDRRDRTHRARRARRVRRAVLLADPALPRDRACIASASTTPPASRRCPARTASRAARREIARVPRRPGRGQPRARRRSASPASPYLVTAVALGALVLVQGFAGRLRWRHEVGAQRVPRRRSSTCRSCSRSWCSTGSA